MAIDAKQCRLSFALLRASIMSIRGARSSRNHPASECPIDCGMPTCTLFLIFINYSVYTTSCLFFISFLHVYMNYYISKKKGVKDAYFVFTAHRVALQCPTSGLWLADDRCYSVMASGHTDSNQVSVTKR